MDSSQKDGQRSRVHISSGNCLINLLYHVFIQNNLSRRTNVLDFLKNSFSLIIKSVKMVTRVI